VRADARATLAGAALDFLGPDARPQSLGARVMQSHSLARVYERWWRPIVFSVTTGFRIPSFAAESEHVLARLARVPGPWLDLSCGPGNLTRRLIENAAGRLVVGVDLSRHMLSVAGRRAPGAELVRADASALPFAQGAFGAVVNLAALDLYPSARRVVLEAARVLAPGGRWIASSFVARPSAASRFIAAATGSQAVTLEGLRAMAEDAGLVDWAALRFGRYVIAWADKPAV
jgi:ubiquinone/menaquinone biosynthesis C-methylase UbiE